MSFNDSIIETFRANDGVVGDYFEGKTLLLLHHVGRQSGKEFVAPLVAAPDGDTYVLCGSAAGAPEDPKWVSNLEAADGPATIELGAATLAADYEVIRPGDPRWEDTYAIWRAYWPAAAEYETKTDRKFPVIRVHAKTAA